MTIELSEITRWLGAVSIGVAGWLWRELASLRADNAALRTHLAENYVTKGDNEKSLDRVYSALERIEKKLDNR